MANNQDQKAIQNALTRVYEVLKFTADEAKGALNDLAGVQQLTVSTELLKSLTAAEVAELNKDFVTKSEEERKTMIEQIGKAHGADVEFMARAQAAAKKVLDDHIAYLKTRGDDGQKEAIGKILAEIG
jgi:hypothetical protein